MLRMKNGLVGFAVVASILSGCQSAQKTSVGYDNVAEEDLNFPGYGSDRTPAGTTPIFDEVFKALRETSVIVGTGAQRKTVSGSAELLRYINRLDKLAIKDASGNLSQISDLRQAKLAREMEEFRAGRRKTKPLKGRDDVLNEADVKGLSPEVQAKIARDFLQQKEFRDLAGLNAIRKKVDTEVAKLADSDAATNKLTGSQKQKLLTDSNGNTRDINAKIATNVELSKQWNELKAGFATMAEQDAYFASTEGKLLINNTRKEAGRIYNLTGMSHLTGKTCENLNKEAMQEYYKLLRDMRIQFEKYTDASGGRIKCKNVGEISAWVAAKFQERLGRTGVSAWTAVREMTVCEYIHPTTGTGARNLASARGSNLGSAPGCE